MEKDSNSSNDGRVIAAQLKYGGNVLQENI